MLSLEGEGTVALQNMGNLLAPQRSSTSWKIFVFGNTPVRTSFIMKLSSVIGWILCAWNVVGSPHMLASSTVSVVNLRRVLL